MKKKTTIILMILLLALSFVMAGCGRDNNDVNDNTPGVNDGVNDNDTRNNNLGDDIDRAGDDIRDDVDNMLGGNDNEGRADNNDVNDKGIDNRDNNKTNGAA